MKMSPCISILLDVFTLLSLLLQHTDDPTVMDQTSMALDLGDRPPLKSRDSCPPPYNWLSSLYPIKEYDGSDVITHGNAITNHMELTSSGDVTKLLEYLDNCRGLISTVDHAEIPTDHQINTLKVDLRFLRTYFNWKEGKDSIWSFGKEIRAFVQNAASEVHSLCVKPTTDGSMTRDLGLFVSNMIEEMMDYKQTIKFLYTRIPSESRLDAPMTKIILKELIDSVLENLKDLQSCETDLIVSLKKHIEALEVKLTCLRNFLSWLVDQRDSKDGVKKDKLTSLLTRMGVVIDNAARWSYFCSVNEVDQIAHLKCNASYLLRMINHIEPEVKDMCVEFLKDSESTQSDTLPADLQTVVSIDSLLDNLMQLLNCNSSFMIPLKDKIAILHQDLGFMRALLMDPPPKKHDKDEEDKFTKIIEDLINDAKSVIPSFYADEMKEERANEMKLVLSSFPDKFKLIKLQVREKYIEVPRKSQFKLFGTDELRFIDLVLNNLDELVNFSADSIVSLKHQVETVHCELMVLKLQLKDIIENCNKHELADLMEHVIDVTHEAESVINSYVVGDGPLWYQMLNISNLLEEFNLVKTELAEILNNKRCDNTVHNIQKPTPLVTSQAHTVTTEVVVVGFEDQAEKIIEQLTRGSTQLDIVSIVGMPGLGKTTLARKVYNDPLVSNHFYIRAWCCVSQAYQKRGLLLDILSQVVEVTDRMHKMSEEDLADKLYKGLKGRKYLIVMDDMWNIDVWDDLRRYFPNDHNGSRITITSRNHEVAVQAKSHSSPHLLRFFSEGESWKLLQEKLFQKESCPMELVEVGKQIAKNCKGLPLYVVLIAGILARMDKKIDRWKQVAANLSTFRVSDSEQCHDILELSYKHLPDHLRPCFLYFGAFAEDKEVPVRKLIRLWVAEGFIQKSEVKGPDDVAEDYLMDLVGRSLVMVTKTRSKGGVKTCHVHDLLHDLCLAKAKEEKFLKLMNGHNELYAPYLCGLDDNASYHLFNSSVPPQRRLCIHSVRTDFAEWRPSDKHVRSLLFFATSEEHFSSVLYTYNFSFIFYGLKLLKVLDISCISMCTFPSEIELLVYLRYLAVRGEMNSIQSSIVNLSNLETLYVKGVRGEVELPDTIWEMVNLRHVLIDDRASIRLLIRRNSLQMHNLTTLGTPSVFNDKDTEEIIRGFPNLRKFKCIFMESWDSISNCNRFPALDFLNQLESLKISYYGKVRNPCKFMFPSNLKKLTLTKFRLPWNEISQIGRLPNLEVLKLLFKSFEGKRWDMKDEKDEEFLNLKYLKLDNLDIAQWNASSDHFPCLERLVLLRCKQLEELPSCLGDVPTLQVIEMQWCNHSAAESARQIQENQKDIGNEDFKVLIKNC
ncbi:putative late blight resistance protein-like protein R1B-16 [Forsythia ovata]|uniref:Late blight resistance protein-like protein R1B-16 n=1 Tax=Forsythia ovata TaxID=205694 RepID=A0ABD1XBI9_9LAMI